MSDKRTHNRISPIGLCLRSLLVLVAALTMAAGMLLSPVDTAWAESKKCSVTVQFPCEGVQAHLYRVGKEVEVGEYKLTGDYADYPVNMDAKTAADTLAGYIRVDELPADATASTGADGKVSFTDLSQGVYLLMYDDLETDQGLMVSSAVLIALPEWVGEDLVYDAEVDGKYEYQPDENTSMKVTKVWDDDDYSERPSSVTVILCQDGKPYEEVVLDEDNRWSKSWPDLEKDHSWTIVEKKDSVTDGYLVNVDVSGSKVTVTNTLPDSLTPKNPTSPDSSKSTTSSSKGSSSKSSSSTSGKSGKLPQTGQIWWPMPYLVGGGALLLILGIILGGRRDKS